MKKLFLISAILFTICSHAQNRQTLVGEDDLPTLVERIIDQRDSVKNDGYKIRKYATENNVTMFTSLDTVKVLLDVLEETTLTISTIDS